MGYLSENTHSFYALQKFNQSPQFLLPVSMHILLLSFQGKNRKLKYRTLKLFPLRAIHT
jgi:hypothetical protein